MPLEDGMKPSQGPAQEPRRKIEITDNGTAVAGPSGGPAVPEGDALRRSAPPPPRPEAKAQEHELKQQIGEMARTIGELKQQLQQQQAEFQLRLQALQAPAAQPQPQQPPQLPPGVDPDAPVTAAQMIEAFSVLPQIIQQQVTSQAIRATWPVTAQMEQDILSRFPEANSLPEPDKTRFILNAAERLGLVRQGTEQQTLQQAAASTPQAPSPAPGTVPLVEQPTQSLEEPQVDDRSAELQRQYDEALSKVRTARNPTERKEWLRKAEEIADEMTRLATGGSTGLRDLFDYEWEQ